MGLPDAHASRLPPGDLSAGAALLPTFRAKEARRKNRSSDL